MTERRVAGPWRTLALTTVCVAGCGSPPAAECPVLPAPAAATVAPPVSTAKASPTSEPVPAAAAPATADLVVVTVTNSAAVPHGRETVALAEAELKKLAPGLELGKTLVVDAAGAVVLSQVVASTNGGAGELVFQADLAPSEQKVFRLRAGERKLAQSGDYQV